MKCSLGQIQYNSAKSSQWNANSCKVGGGNSVSGVIP